jgi:hypothetical protein
MDTHPATGDYRIKGCDRVTKYRRKRPNKKMLEKFLPARAGTLTIR